jgi:hypothetical protein
MHPLNRLSNSESKANPLRTLHYSAVGYVLLLCLTTVTASGLVKVVANAAAIGIFALAAINWLFYRTKTRITTAQALSLVVFYIGMLGSVFFTYKGEELVDIIKIAIAPFFLVIGASLSNETAKWSIKDSTTRLLFGALIILPLISIFIQLATGSQDAFGSKQLGFFANRNNAGLYAIAILAFYCVLAEKVIAIPLVYVAVGLMFGTLGLLLAVVAAIFLCHGNIKYFFAGLLLGTFSLFVLNFLPDLSNTLRVKPVVDSISLLLSGRIDLETVTYGDLVLLLNTQDLSFLFRLKHWYNLLNIYASGTISNYLFGFGAGSAVQLSSIHLVPHNDYIRLIFEFGAVTFLAFTSLLFSTIRAIQRGWALVPVLVVVIYFFSENLINNYLAMIFFFLSAGALSARNRFALKLN